ncbi:MAG: translocation/assembly module TamB domain-containing protein [Desulfuromonadaceae bacterium]|nr:translocation/assembly module TamB domain-containing protein [Desulfuromonadaceae bacterium]
MMGAPKILKPRRWIIRIAVAAVVLFVVVTAFVAVLGTSSGNRWLLAAVSRLEPRLAVTLDSGTLLGEATLSNLRWTSTGFDILIPHLEWKWDWRCLKERTLCLDQVHAQGVRLSLTEDLTAEVVVDPVADVIAVSEENSLKLPFVVEIRNLHVQQTWVDAYGQIITLAELHLAARLNDNGLQVSPLKLRDLLVVIAPSPADSALCEPKAAVADILVLPEINLPLAIALDGLDLTNAQIRQAETEYLIQHLHLSARAAGSEVEITTLEITTPEVSLQTQAQVRLTADYPVSLQAHARLLELPPLSGLAVQLTLSGSVGDIALDLSTTGPITAQLQAQAKLLDPLLPFAAHLSWQDLNWPVQQPVWHAEQGQVEVGGSLEGYALQFSGGVKSEPYPDIAFVAIGQGDVHQLRLDFLSVEALEGSAELTGLLRWEDDLVWQGELSFQQLNPAELVAQLPGQLSGRLNTEFLLHDDSWDLRVQQIEVNGKLAGQPLRLSGGIQGMQSGDWQISQLQLHSGANRLAVNGQISEESNLTGELEIVDLQTSLPQASGTARGEFNLSGRREALQLEFSLVAEKLAYAEQKIEALDAGAQLEFTPMPQGSVRIKAAGMAYQGFSFDALNVTFSGDSAAHSLSLDLRGEEFSGNSSLKGQLVEQLWSAQLQTSWVETPLGRWSLDVPFDINYDFEHQRAVIAKHCWHSGDASLCLNEAAEIGEAGQLSISLQDFSSPQLPELLPEGLTWQGSLAANADARWTPEQKPRIEAELVTGSGSFEIVQGGEQLRMDYQQLRLSAVLDEKSAQATLLLRSEQFGEGDISLQLFPYQEEQPLQGEFRLSNLQLDVLQPLIAPLEEISGTVDAAGSISGSLKQPQLSGTVFLRDGYLGGKALPSDVEQVNLQIDLEGYQAQLAGDLMFGEGHARLAGAVSWEETSPIGWLTLQGERHNLNLEPELRLLFSPDLRFDLQPEGLFLTGGILVPSGRIKVKTLPQGAVRLSDDVVVLDDPNATKDKRELPFTLALEVALLDEVRIEAFGLKAGLEGVLALKQSPTQPLSGNGSIDLREGTYRAFGQNLLIKKGLLLFFGSLSEPFVDVDAIRNSEVTSDHVIAGIRLQGEAQKPKVTIYSEPTMSQQEAISYLLRGRSLGAGSGTSQDVMLATLLVGAGIDRSEGTISEVGRAFGVQDLAFDTRGEGSDTKVQASGYLFPGVQVGYGVGIFSPLTEITLRYEILHNLVLEAVSSLQSAVDLLYEFEF